MPPPTSKRILRSSKDPNAKVIADAKRSTAIIILQARLKMVEDLEKRNNSSWEVEKWNDSLVRLYGDDGEVSLAQEVEKEGMNKNEGG
ncbi:hypothetical protein L1887_23939 [Cichorium endivia]|nr:hypothetical protein L1887_23939 [Cichorium endivia]